MVLVLKKEVIKTNEAVEQEDANKYRQLLVRTLHQCSVRFPDVAPIIIPVVSNCMCSLYNQNTECSLPPTSISYLSQSFQPVNMWNVASNVASYLLYFNA